MTTTLEIIAKIRSSGGSIWSEHGDLLIEAQPGILTRDDTEILVRHKPELITILDRPIPVEDLDEREAIRWTETAPRTEISAALDQALTELELIVQEDTPLTDGPSSGIGVEESELSEESPITIRAEHTSGGLRLHCPTPEIAAAVEAGRVELETILAGGDQDQDGHPFEDLLIVDPVECQKCGSINAWIDLVGGWHCEDCEPRFVGEMLRARAARIRKRNTYRTRRHAK